ncbi:hypothetical protein CLN94_01655 [Pseudothioclava arenosa]|uniref:Uncharacterized protein n=1 Tax=Pseudothioclava arenosa TaxID=1795308 RepID=A0A2A4CUS8_9RHOB|nr:hypothetical protein CLN94_01655 [Pseudothioclava arenosa]
MLRTIFICVLMAAPLPTAAAVSQGAVLAGQGDAIAHGGGCRKDSPAGKCCHMDRKAGVVHCH